MKLYKISGILFWVFVILTIILFVWMVIGGSPTADQIFIMFFGGFMIKLHNDIGNVREKVGEHTQSIRGLEKYVQNIEIELKIHTKSIRNLENGVREIKNLIKKK